MNFSKGFKTMKHLVLSYVFYKDIYTTVICNIENNSHTY